MDFKIILFLCFWVTFVAGKRLPRKERGGINMFGPRIVCRCYKSSLMKPPPVASDLMEEPKAAPAGRLTMKQKINKFHKFVLQDFKFHKFGCWCTRSKRSATLLALLRHAQIVVKRMIKLLRKKRVPSWRRKRILNGLRRRLVRGLMRSFRKHIPKSILKHMPKVLYHGLKTRNGWGVGLQAMGPLFHKLGFSGQPPSG